MRVSSDYREGSLRNAADWSGCSSIAFFVSDQESGSRWASGSFYFHLDTAEDQGLDFLLGLTAHEAIADLIR